MVGIRSEQLESFVEWADEQITGDEKGEAQIFLDRLFQAFGQPGCLDVGGTPEFRIRKPREDGGGTAFADYVWKPFVLIEMKRRGRPLAPLPPGLRPGAGRKQDRPRTIVDSRGHFSGESETDHEAKP